MQIRIESKLGTRLWTHQARIDDGVFSLNLSNANELDIVEECITCIYIYIMVLIVHSFSSISY